MEKVRLLFLLIETGYTKVTPKDCYYLVSNFGKWKLQANFDSTGKVYVKDNFFHREDGPALIYENGSQEWCYDGYFHREDGPAIIHSYKKSWFIHGNLITNEVDQWILENDLPTWEEWTDEIKVMFKLRFC